MTSSPFLYLVTILTWGTSWFAIKFQLGVVAPEISLIYRFGLAASLLIVFCLFKGLSLAFGRRDHVFILLQGACLFSGNYLIFYHATALLASGLVAVVFSSIMFMNMFNGALFLRRQVEPRVMLGALLGLCGITLVFWPEIANSGFESGVVRGLLMSVVATYLASLGNIISARNQQQGLPVIQTNALGMGYGTLLMLLVAVVSGTEFNFDTSLSYSLSGLFEDFDWSVAALVGVGFVLLGNVLIAGLPER